MLGTERMPYKCCCAMKKNVHTAAAEYKIEPVLLTGKHIDHSGERIGIHLLLCTFITGPFAFNCDLNYHSFEEGRLRLLWA